MKPVSKMRRGMLVLLLVGLVSNALSGDAGKDPSGKDYKIGDRLTPAAGAASGTTGPYRKLNWDELMPSHWDPMKALKGLDLSNMQDSDPRAREALEKVRVAWNDAPVVSELNGVQVEIPGFVVPLDTDPNRIKEFLLVPYFGACIHVPPPPSNQVLHVLVPKKLTRDQQVALKNAVRLYGTISVSGTLETVSVNTAMGFSGYRIKADAINAYKAPANGGSAR